MSEVILSVENLSKQYRLGVLGYGTVYRDLQSWWAKIRRKEDPNSKINSNILNIANSESSDKFWALKDISFQVQQGDILGIIGRNGAGKSTLLKVLSRVTSPTEGCIKTKGRIASLLEVGTGFHPELTGRENIYLNGAILGMTKSEIKKKFDEIVDFAEVEKFIDTPVKRYSSGMYVRLAFAVAAHLSSEILIVDEVLAVGDLNFRKKCLGKMKDISSSSGRTVLFVSHDMTAVKNICNRGILLKKGQVEYEGNVGDTISKYLCEAQFSNNKMEWSYNGKPRPFDEIVRVKRFYIEDEDGNIPNGRLFNSKKYNAIIEADLKVADPRLIFALGYYSEDKYLLFMTGIHDAGEINFSTIGTGEIKMKVPIPVDMLWNKNYEIEILSALHYTGWIFPTDNETRIGFEFYRDVDLDPYSNDTRLGAIAPVIKWEVER